MLFILNNGGETYTGIIRIAYTAKDICYFNHCLVIWIATYRHGFMYSYYNIAITIL